MSDDYIYYGPETAALEISSDGKVQRVIPRAITVEKGSATPMGDGFDKYRQYDQDLRDAYTAGLDAAREAVLALPHYRAMECDPGLMPGKHDDSDPWLRGYLVDSDKALAAIDALRERP